VMPGSSYRYFAGRMTALVAAAGSAYVHYYHWRQPRGRGSEKR
jgi:hypothetical protein